MHTIIELAVPVYCIWVFIGLCLFGFGGTVYTMVSTPVEEEKLKDALKWANAGVAGRETQIVELRATNQKLADRLEEASDSYTRGYALGSQTQELLQNAPKPEPKVPAKKKTKPRAKKLSGK